MSNRKETERKLLFDMLLIRRFEERAAQQYQEGKIGGFCHLYIGQEAVAVGAVAAARSDDYFVTAYRDHGHALACGISANACMAELFGRETGCSKGLGGSMHLFDPAKRMMGGHAIVGAHVPLATGMAFAAQYRGEDRVTLCFFGDGAINQGAFHEALNLASLWRLRIVFVCENNQFAMGTSVARSTALKEITQRAAGYNIPACKINGMDVRAVRDGLKTIIEKVRCEGGPYLVEMSAFRYRGHSMSDPATYRTREELERNKESDPIILLRHQLKQEQLLDDGEFDQMDAEAKRLVTESVRSAEESPELSSDTLGSFTFVNTHS